MRKNVSLDAYEVLSDNDLVPVVGGSDKHNVFYQLGKIAGKGLYWFCKGSSAIKG